MLRPQEEYNALDKELLVKLSMDPLLRGSRRRYKEQLADLDRRGLFYLSATSQEQCAMISVKKESGKF